MNITKPAICGSLQSNDCYVRIYPGKNGIELELSSPVFQQFGTQIEKVVRDTLEAMQITRCRLVLEDKGALDYTIRARVETVVKRAHA